MLACGHCCAHAPAALVAELDLQLVVAAERLHEDRVLVAGRRAFVERQRAEPGVQRHVVERLHVAGIEHSAVVIIICG